VEPLVEFGNSDLPPFGNDVTNVVLASVFQHEPRPHVLKNRASGARWRRDN
jgi:hypothetical protein